MGTMGCYSLTPVQQGCALPVQTVLNHMGSDRRSNNIDSNSAGSDGSGRRTKIVTIAALAVLLVLERQVLRDKVPDR